MYLCMLKSRHSLEPMVWIVRARRGFPAGMKVVHLACSGGIHLFDLFTPFNFRLAVVRGRNVAALKRDMSLVVLLLLVLSLGQPCKQSDRSCGGPEVLEEVESKNLIEYAVQPVAAKM